MKVYPRVRVFAASFSDGLLLLPVLCPTSLTFSHVKRPNQNSSLALKPLWAPPGVSMSPWFLPLDQKTLVMALPVSNPPVQLEKSYEKKERKKKNQLFKGIVFLEFCVFFLVIIPWAARQLISLIEDNGYLNIKYVQPQYPLKRDSLLWSLCIEDSKDWSMAVFVFSWSHSTCFQSQGVISFCWR